MTDGGPQGRCVRANSERSTGGWRTAALDLGDTVVQRLVFGGSVCGSLEAAHANHDPAKWPLQAARRPFRAKLSDSSAGEAC